MVSSTWFKWPMVSWGLYLHVKNSIYRIVILHLVVFSQLFLEDILSVVILFTCIFILFF